jgi:hypothetical protein
MIFRSPVITCPDGLYWKGEWEQSQVREFLRYWEPQHINWKHNFKIIMDAVEDYARRWIKREVDQDPELESLSDWVRTIRSLVQGRIHKLKNCVNSHHQWLHVQMGCIEKESGSSHNQRILKVLFYCNVDSFSHGIYSPIATLTVSVMVYTHILVTLRGSVQNVNG